MARWRSFSDLIPGVFSQVHRVGFATVDVARRIGRYSFRRCATSQNLKSRIARAVRGDDFWRRFFHWSGRRDQAFDRSIFGAADSNASLKAGVCFLVRLRIRHIDGVVRINENTARAAKLFPFSEELALLIENLNAAVPAVTHE